jgi:hypothetical protein
MHSKSKNGFKFANTSLNIWQNPIKYSIVPLVPNTPTSYDHYFHKEIKGHPPFGIIHHLVEIQINIPFYTKSPPEALAEGTLKE